MTTPSLNFVESVGNSRFQLGDISAPSNPTQGSNPSFTNLKSVEITVPNELKRPLFGLIKSTMGLSVPLMAIGLEADHIDKIKLDAARGNISVSFTTNQQAVTIASYPVKDTFVTRGSIFDTDRIQLQMSPQFGEPPNQLIQTIRDLFQEAGAFNTQEGELRLAAGRDDQSPKPARAALMRHLCRSEDVIMNRASRQSA